jgi:predicted dehydrogenase
MKTIRVGFVGLGGICRQRHVPGLRHIEGVEIAAVANRTRASGEAAAREFGIPVVCDSWRELVARDDLDAVFIGTWPYMHCPISLAAFDAGKHVFCQARMAMNLAEAQMMYHAAKAADRVAMLCPVPVGLSVDATVARWISEGRLGDVRYVRAQSFSDAYADPGAPMNWRKDDRMSGLNTLTLGMFIEVVHRWFGWTRAVQAWTQTFTTERVDAGGVRMPVHVPDQILFDAEMESGLPVQYAFSGVVSGGKDALAIYGTRGSLHYDVASGTLAFASKDQSVPVEILPEDAYDETHWRVERDFIDAIRCGKLYHPNFEDGLRYMQVVQAVFDSAAAKRWVRLGDPRG